MEPSTYLQDDWQQLLAMLPSDRDAMAKAAGALQRRREVGNADSLLRLALAYSWLGLSLRNTAAWAEQNGVASLSDVAVLKQLRHASGFLQDLVSRILQRHTNLRSLKCGNLSVQIVDASVVTETGSVGTDWRVHLGIDLASLSMTQIEVTDASGGESFTRFTGAPNQVIMGDRAYAKRRGIAHVVETGGHVLVRLNWNNTPLLNPDTSPFDLFLALSRLAEGEAGEWAVQIAPDIKNNLLGVPGRLVAIRKSEAAAEATRREIRKQASKKGRTTDPRTLQAAGYIFVFTTVSKEDLPTRMVLELYRFRWQIELAFKRFKSLLGMDELRAHDPELCRTFLYGKLLAALLIEDLSDRSVFSPWDLGDATTAFGLALDPNDMEYAMPSDRNGKIDRFPTGIAARAKPILRLTAQTA